MSCLPFNLKWWLVDVTGHGSDGLRRHINDVIGAPTAEAAVLAAMDTALFPNETRRCRYGYHWEYGAHRRLIVFLSPIGSPSGWFQTEREKFDQMATEVGSPEEAEWWRKRGDRPYVDKLPDEDMEWL